MSFRITCKCGAVIPPERLIGVRLDEIPKMCDDCAAASKIDGNRRNPQEKNQQR